MQGDPVAEQQKKIQTEKALDGCSTIPEDQKYKYQLGVTMVTTSNGTPFIVRLTAIDCRIKKVTVTKPGKLSAHDFVMTLPFEEYERYKKHDKQFRGISSQDSFDHHGDMRWGRADPNSHRFADIRLGHRGRGGEVHAERTRGAYPTWAASVAGR